MKIVLDNRIILNYIKYKDKYSKKLVYLIYKKKIIPIISEKFITNLLELFNQGFISTNKSQINDFLYLYVQRSILIDSKSNIKGKTSKDNEIYLNLAVDGKAQFIVTNRLKDFDKADGYKLINVIELKNFVTNI